MSSIAVILARGGSKGLPGKNALPLGGKPVLAWTIEHALATPGLARVVLSTDSDHMARIGRRYGVEVVLRPPRLCDDTAPVADAARFTVAADEAGVAHYDAVAILYGNVPIRPDDLTRRALRKLENTGCDSVQSVHAVGKTHPYWMKTLGDEARQDELVPFVENSIDRRQDLPAVYQLNGGVIAVTRQSLFTYDRTSPHAFLGADRRAIITGEDAVVDIDTRRDLLLAEAIMRDRAEADRAAAREREAAASVAA